MVGRAAGSRIGVSSSLARPVMACFSLSSGATLEMSPVRLSRPSSTHFSAAIVASSFVAEARNKTSSSRCALISSESKTLSPKAFVVGEFAVGICSSTQDGAVDLAGLDGSLEASLDDAGHGRL